MGMTACFQSVTADQFEKIKSDPDYIESIADNIFDGKPEGEVCDLDKSWQVIHYLISGHVWDGSSPQSQVILGGTEIGEDLGYGPARFHDPEQVKLLASSIRDIGVEELHERFDPQAMAQAELYAFSADCADDEFEMAQDYFADLKEFYLDAANRGDAILAFII